MQTETGAWDLESPDPDAVDWTSVARGLARIARYNGRTVRRMSVAEHCVLIADHLQAEHGPRVALAGLLHDAGEAFYGDMIWPVQAALKARSPHALQALKELQALTDAAIASAAGLHAFDLRLPQVKEADLRILLDERAALFDDPPTRSWGAIEDMEPLGVEIACWDEDEAADWWLGSFLRLRAILGDR